MIVLFERGSIPRSMEDGLSSVFNLLGHGVVSYDPRKTPTFDAFDKASPNLYIGSVIHQQNAVKKCLVEFQAKFHATEAISAGADVVSQKAGNFNERYASEVVYVGEYEESLAEYIGLATEHFQLKIFQESRNAGVRWGIKNEIGAVDKKQLSDIYASSKCSLAFGDVFKFYEILLSGGFPMANKSILNHFPYAYGFNSPEGMFLELSYVVKEVGKNTIGIVKQRMLEEVLRNHTYFHRVFDIFNNIKKPKEATRTLDFYYDNFPIRK